MSPANVTNELSRRTLQVHLGLCDFTFEEAYRGAAERANKLSSYQVQRIPMQPPNVAGTQGKRVGRLEQPRDRIKRRVMNR